MSGVLDGVMAELRQIRKAACAVMFITMPEQLPIGHRFEHDNQTWIVTQWQPRVAGGYKIAIVKENI